MRTGETIPRFELEDEDGVSFSSNNLKGAPSVIYFYPKDDTPGCTAEACSFRDQFEDFTQLGARVIGISNDDSASHRRFKEKHRLPFTLLSDPNGNVKKAFGVKGNLFGLLSGRVTFIFNEKCELVHQFDSQINVLKHVKEALSILKHNHSPSK